MAPFLATLFIIICVLLIVIVLLQKGRGSGLGGAFGGIGSSAFGTKTGDVFTWVTIVLVGLFLLLSVGTAVYFRPAEQQVQDPVFKPQAGTPLAKKTHVSILAQTPRSEIHFTRDGSEPTRRSERYDSPLWIEPGTTIKARAFLAGHKESEVVTASYPPAAPQATRPLTTTTAPAPATAPAQTQPTRPAK